jgi:hypothetical protein
VRGELSEGSGGKVTSCYERSKRRGGKRGCREMRGEIDGARRAS